LEVTDQQPKMDARNRLSRKQAAKNRSSNGTTSGLRSNLIQKRGLITARVNTNRVGLAATAQSSAVQSKFDSKRLGFVAKGNEALDLRKVLQDKKEEEERKKRFAANLQSRLGLQSRAAREEVKKQRESLANKHKPTSTKTEEKAVKASVRTFDVALFASITFNGFVFHGSTARQNKGRGQGGWVGTRNATYHR
jgi:hypothetical protein